MNRKVLIIVENLPVPFDTRVWKEASALREAGYQVTDFSALLKRDKTTIRVYLSNVFDARPLLNSDYSSG